VFSRIFRWMKWARRAAVVGVAVERLVEISEKNPADVTPGELAGIATPAIEAVEEATGARVPDELIVKVAEAVVLAWRDYSRK